MKYYGIIRLAAALAFAGVVGLTTVGSTSARTGDNPTPTCPAPYVFNTTTGKCDSPATTTQVTTNVIGAKASADDVATGKVTILAYVKAKGLSKGEKSRAKRMRIGRGTSVPVYWNSGVNALGQLFWFKDSRPITAYRVNGQWRKGPCGNFLRFHKPIRVVTGRVIMVRSFASVKIHLHAQASVTATSPDCPGTFGSASGSADITISLNEFVRNRGPIQSRLTGTATGRASAHAAAQVVCGPTATPQVVSFVKHYVAADGTDQTAQHFGGIVPLSATITRNGTVVATYSSFTPAVRLGVPFSTPAAQPGDDAKFCIPSDYAAHENEGMFDPVTGKIDLCVVQKVQPGLNTIIDRVKPTATSTTTTTSTTPPSGSFSMVFDTINDIPAGTCRPETLHVSNTVASGQIQIYTGRSVLSQVDCYQAVSQQPSVIYVSVGTGNTSAVVYVYAPNDSSATSDTLTAVPLINGVDSNTYKTSTSFTISHPVRP